MMGDNLIGAPKVQQEEQGLAVRLKSPQASRRHAIITINELGATLRDCNSMNGTFITPVRGEHGPVRLAPSDAVMLSDGDHITFANEVAFVVFCPPAAGAAMLNTLPLIQQQQQRAPEGNALGNIVAGAAVGGDVAAAAAAVARTKLDLQTLRQQSDLHYQTNILQLQVLQQQHEISLADVNQKMDSVNAQLQQQRVLLLAYEQQAQQQQQQQQQEQPVLVGGIGACLNFDHAELILIESLTPNM